MNQKLEEVIQSYILNDEMGALVRYLDEIKVDEATKEEMIQAIKMFRLKVLYDVLLDKFEMILSNEEKEKYKRERQCFFA